MNKLSVIILSLFFSSQIAFSQGTIDASEKNEEKKIALNWAATYKEALHRSKKENKPLLIYFTGSDWCAPCKILDRDLFHSEKFKLIADQHLVLLEVDIPRRLDLLEPFKLKENLTLKSKYDVNSFPTLLFVNHRGRKIAIKKGYIITEYYYPFIQGVIDNY